jgi:hypothetical protein
MARHYTWKEKNFGKDCEGKNISGRKLYGPSSERPWLGLSCGETSKRLQ